MSHIMDADRIVVKIGSALVTDAFGKPRKEWLGNLARDIKWLVDNGKQIVLVSSGAIALGRPRLSRTPKRLEEKQAAAAIGQPVLMSLLSDAFAVQELYIAQALLTLSDTEDRRRWLNARATLDTLMGDGIIPVINENDTIATDEIRYGDNDRLAARVAQMISAQTLVLLSDVDGLYTGDPRSNSQVEHIATVREITPDIIAMAGGANTVSGVGSGGMATKVVAAQIAWDAGCKTVIAKGSETSALKNIGGKGQRVTWFIPPQSPESARAIWLRSHLTPEGTIIIDNGAAQALSGGASLLPVGIKSVDGSFDRGAAVQVIAENGVTLGKGVTAYAAVDIERIKGLQTDAVEQTLGVKGRPAVIHRDDLVLD